MEIGKIPNDILRDIVFGKLKNKRSEVLVRPGIGEDCCVVDFGEYVCVMSSDPITGAVNEVGKLAVLVTCNDIASCGVEPLGLLVTILAPPGTTAKELEAIMDQLTATAAAINVDIMGGHTEITSSVNRFVITSTAIGRAPKNRLITTKGAKSGDSIVLTKSAGMEGTSIVAYDKEEELAGFLGKELLDEAKSFMNSISVIKEGLIAADFGVSAMHDVTEGGLLGAVWELCEASGRGAEIFHDKIPIAESTKRICEFYGINPLKLISSGCMLIAAPDGEGLVKRLNTSGIAAAVIGSILDNRERILVSGNEKYDILQPGSDDLFRITEKK